jgi:radical SAM superfamily enzyme YgiQ (UPF0313 family)
MLIEPPFYRLFEDAFSLVKFPLALGYLSAVILKETDWAVQAFNADFNTERSTENVELGFLSGEGYENYIRALDNRSTPIWQEVEAAIRDFSPGVVGITSKTQNFASAKIVAEIAKRIDPNIVVIVGGPHPSMAGEEAIECTDIDVAVVGEGEQTIIELLRAIGNGDRDLLTIPGIVVRKDGEIVRTPPRQFISDLDSLPFPHESAARALRDFDKYPLSAFSYVFATRGCPYYCQFCGSRDIWSRKVRYRSPRNVVDEMKGLREMGITLMRFDDDTFGISKNYIQELCGLIQSECPDVKWVCEIVVNIVNEENLDAMKAGGCSQIKLGIESGNNEILKKIRKNNITIGQALEAAKLIRKKGIELQAFFMLGHLHDTEETLADTMKAIETICADFIILSIFTPYPGSESFHECVKYGLIEKGYDVARYNHQSPENCFTAHIEKARFKELVTEMTAAVDRINKRRRRAYQLRAYRELLLADLKHRGIAFTAGRIAKFLMKRGRGRLEWLTS